MSQQGIHDYLQANPGWKTTKQIAKALGVSNGSVTTSANKMLRWEEVKRKKVKIDSYNHYAWKLNQQ